MSYTTIKGFRDILPQETALWQRVEAEARELLAVFGYKEIRTPVLEKTELFARSIGQDTDIVSKEMYTFHDAKGRSFSLRPEATASVARAYIQNRLYHEAGAHKFFTMGPMFRHERPQKGRYRQFHQINAELFKDPGPRSDADVILLAMTLMERVGLKGLSLHLNSIGCQECRPAFLGRLRSYLEKVSEGLCSDCQRRAIKNPLRVFDCKLDSCKDTMIQCPKILEFLCEDCNKHFQALREYLEVLHIQYIIDPYLVRGLDYYSRTTFEIQSQGLGAQNAVLGGGRYDGLLKQLGGPDEPAIGFAVGIERVIMLLSEGPQKEQPGPALFIASLGPDADQKALLWAVSLRKAGIWVEFDYTPGGLKAQMRRADRMGAHNVLIVGEEELERGYAILRNMLTKEQQRVQIQGLVERLKEVLSRP